MCWLDRAPRPPFDDRIRNEPRNDLVGQFVGHVVAKTDSAPGCRSVDVDTESLTRVANGISAAVGHAGLERDLHGMAGWEVPIATLQQWVDEHAVETIAVS